MTLHAYPQKDPLPQWAYMQIAVLQALAESVDLYLDKYTDHRGWLIWRDTWHEEYQSRDGIDDFYEAFYNFPLVYLLGGEDKFLELSLYHWQAVTDQLTHYGVLRADYDRGYDQFHQSEGYLFFYYLCMAAPDHPLLREQAQRFAGFFLNEDPDAINYDAGHKILLAPHNGSDGARPGYFDEMPLYPYVEGMRPYGLPYYDVEGIESYADLRDHDKALRMGEVMQQRMGKGDVVNNLFVTSLIMNAYLMTSDDERRDTLRDWIRDYVRGWMDRTAQNNGLIPDNVGLNGQVGEYMNGRWYGGLYGWTWPHGFYNISLAVAVAAINLMLVTGEKDALDFAEEQFKLALDRGEQGTVNPDEMTLYHHFPNHGLMRGDVVWMTPYRYSDHGWFDWHPLPVIIPANLWSLRPASEYAEYMQILKERSAYDWNRVLSFRTKEDSGHEEAWWQFLAGENPSFPEAMLHHALTQIAERVAMIRSDDADLTQVNIHHWQLHNPVLTEPLIQQRFGVPKPIYYGGLLVAPLFYVDAERHRPGLPPDVSALVEKRDGNTIQVHIANTSAIHTRKVRLYAGSLGQHRFTTITAQNPTGDEAETIGVDGQMVDISLSPNSAIRLICAYDGYVNTPTYIRTVGKSTSHV